MERDKLMHIIDLLMKYHTCSLHTTVDMMAICTITVTERLTALSIRRTVTFSVTVCSMKSLVTD